MLNNLGWGELLMLGLLGLLIFGPEQLPKIAADVGRMVRQLRRFASDASEDLRSELGPEFKDVDLASLNPRKFIEKHVLADDDEDDLPRKPRTASRMKQDGDGAAPSAAETPAGESSVPVPYDADAT